MKASPFSTARRDGVALVIILAFLALLTVLIVAFFSRALTARQVSTSSAAQAQAEALARSAASTIIGDLKQEMAAGSTSYTPIPATGVTIYTPTADPTGQTAPPVLTSSVVPWVSGAPTPLPGGTPPIPNLIRRSVRATDPTIVPYPSSYVSPPPNRASPVNSTNDVSANGRSVSLTQWNAHYLIPTSTAAGSAAGTPIASFTAPDWVIVTKEKGPDVLQSPTTDVSNKTVTPIGRFAYAIYDEGGLLDANVAGCPSNLTSSNLSANATLSAMYDPKGFAAFADLTALGLTQQQSDTLVGWRNFATAQPSGTLASSYAFNSSSATSYFNYILGQTSGFLFTNTNNFIAGTTPGTYTSTPMTFGTPAQMDQVFANRQSLIRFWTAQGFPMSSLQYFATFTRDLNRPNFVPLANPFPLAGLSPSPIITYPTPTTSSGNPIQSPVPPSPATSPYTSEPNPIVQNILITGATGTSARTNGTPVMTQRFPLSKIALLASPAANAIAIKHYFGLALNSDGYSWTYGHSAATGTIMSLASVATMSGPRESGYPQEPDFFECLQAAILYGSLGNYNDAANDLTATIPTNGYDAFNATKSPSQFGTSIIQMGANLIDQYDADNLPTVINFGTNTYAGIENLPYFSEMLFWPYRPIKTIPLNNPATGEQVGDPYQHHLAAFGLFELWNPHQNAPFFASGKSPKQLRITLVAGSIGNFVYAPGSVAGVGSTAFAGPLPPNLTSSLHVTFNYLESFQEPTILGTTDSAASGAGENDWFQLTDVSGPTMRSGLLLGEYNCPDYDLDTEYKQSTYGDDRYPTCSWNSTGAGGGEVTILLQFTIDGTNWLTYEGANSSSSPQWIDANVVQNQINAAWKNPWSPYGPPSATNTAFSVYNFVGQESAAQIPDPRANTCGANVVGQSTYALSMRPGTGLSASGGPQADRYNIDEPPNYAYPVYGGGSTYKDYSGNLTEACVAMYNENADNNNSKYQLTNPFLLPPSTGYNTYLVDPDGVMRPGDGFYGADPYISGSATSMAIRPILLNRPFRSVGEMGYSNRGWGPWKSINFFSEQSADAGLLDYFSIDSTPISAGKINLNTRQSPVLQAMLQGAYRIEPLSSTTVDTLTPSDAGNLAAAVVAHTGTTVAPTQSTPASPPYAPPYIPGPLISRADLVRGLLGDPNILSALKIIKGTASTDLANTAKTRREAFVRALADVGTTRTWNLLIDIVAQAGSYPPNATALSGFNVTGEKHYWLHVALDRYTGAIIDEQMEPVNE
jgi:hypothetical protein